MTVRRCLLEGVTGGEALAGQFPTTQSERSLRHQPTRQDGKRLSTGTTDPASYPNRSVPVIVALPEPASMANDRTFEAERAPPRQQLQGNYPGSVLSFVSGSAIKRITAGVKARRDRPCQVSICWPGLHPPGKVSSNEKRILLCTSVRQPATHDDWPV